MIMLCKGLRIRLRTLSSSASSAASKRLLERGLCKLKAGRAKKSLKNIYGNARKCHLEINHLFKKFKRKSYRKEKLRNCIKNCPWVLKKSRLSTLSRHLHMRVKSLYLICSEPSHFLLFVIMCVSAIFSGRCRKLSRARLKKLFLNVPHFFYTPTIICELFHFENTLPVPMNYSLGP